MRTSGSILILLVTLVLSSVAIAEGQISGLVRSESGRELAGITVTLQASDGRPIIQFTDAFGRYRFDSIESGVYQISYEDRNFINFIDDDPFPDEGSVYIGFTSPNLVTLQDNQQLNLAQVVLQLTDPTDNRQAIARVSNCATFSDDQDTRTLSFALENAREIIIECTGAIPVPEITLRRDVVITASTSATFEGLGISRVLRVLPGVVAEISGVSLVGGNLPFGSVSGSAIFNAGITTINNAEISGNVGDTAVVSNQGILNLNQVRQFGNSILFDSVYRNTGVINGTNVIIGSHTATAGPVITNNGTIELRGCRISGLGTNNVWSVNNNAGATFKLFDCTVTNSASLFQNDGTLEIFDSSLENNTRGDQSLIDSSGVLRIGGTGVTNNSVSGQVIFNQGSAQILNSTISANRGGFSSSGDSSRDSQGGISNQGLMTIMSSTIVGNTNPAVSDRQIGNSGELQLSNTIILGTGNGEECGGDAPVTSQGYNVHTDGTCGNATQTDIPFGNPGLVALAENGGLGRTHALQSGSDAIDAGNCNNGATSIDQRQVSRPQGNDCDIGAFELEVSGTAPPIDMTPNTGNTDLPICASSATDPDGDGFGFENNQSCIVDSSSASTGTGTSSGTTNTGLPVCASSATDPDGDGFGFENNQSCIVDGTSAGTGSTNTGLPVCASSATDPDGDGFGFENNQSCVVDGSSATTGTGTSSGTGTANTGLPVCASSATDPDGDGFGFENNRSCIVDGSSASTSTGSGTTNSRLPICASSATDPDGDGFGFENNRSCIVDGSSAGTSTGGGTSNSRLPICASSASDPDGDGFGFENNRSCIVEA